MKAFFVRHGQSNYNLKDLCNDDPKKDVHLTPLGIKQSEEIAERLRDKGFEVIFVSEFSRTRQTAEIINKYHNAPIRVDTRTNERISGFEGKPTSEFEKHISKDRFHIKPKNGESFQEEKKRVFSFLEGLKEMKYDSVLVVTHGDNLVIVSGYFNKLSDEEMWSRPYPENGCVLEFNI